MNAADIIAAQIAAHLESDDFATIAAAIVAELRGAGYIVDPAPDLDPERLAALLASVEPIGSTDIGPVWHDDGDGTAWASFRAREAYTGDLADALGWECVSCRPDVGWADHQGADRDAAGVITLRVECGHCGYVAHYTEKGEPTHD